MGKSPGHREHPEHKVAETKVSGPVRVLAEGQPIVEAQDVIRVDEDGHPPRYYFRREDVRSEALKLSSTTTQCPFKGTARYFDLELGPARKLHDAVWSYEDPFDEHAALKNRVAFYDDHYPEIVIEDGTRARAA